MKIGMYISPAHTVPPNEKNILAPWILAGQLADGLVGNHHDVTLFAAKGSATLATLVHAGIKASVLSREEFGDLDAYRAYVLAQELSLMRECIRKSKSRAIDILHIHHPIEKLYPALLAMPAATPIVITFHDPIAPERFPALEKLHGLGNVHFVSLSASQQNGVPFPFAGVVPNGVDTTLFHPDTDLPLHDHPFIMTGRIVEQKGFHDAIQAVGKTGNRLCIIGQSYDHNDAAKTYYEKQIVPNIDNARIMMEPVVKPGHLVGHYQAAKALLFPIHWEEPFGLVMVEAMACGTPVIAYNRGSVSEIVKDGVTGYIVDPPETDVQQEQHRQMRGSWKIKAPGVDGIVEAMNRIGDIKRAACRKHVEDHFSLSRMVQGYEDVYKKIRSATK